MAEQHPRPQQGYQTQPQYDQQQQHQGFQYDDQQQPKGFLPQNGPSAKHIVAMLALVPIGGTLLFLAGLTLAGTILGLAVSTPLFVIFSPILVPAALVIGLSVVGILTSGAFGITALSSFSWLAHFLSRSRLPEQIGKKVQETTGYLGLKVQEMADYLGQKMQESGGQVGHLLQETGGQVGQKTREMGKDIQDKAQDAGRTLEAGRDQEGGKTKAGGRGR
ncbi:oleosin 18.2 kDa-like [Prunus avium]|uniref:Oleosin n=1 Tax=Prunus avium TaxID=42229 RepID=A0A6P5RA14_PRUAV|nr:oleosin 18.2 kDa-like [Prunus avium]